MQRELNPNLFGSNASDNRGEARETSAAKDLRQVVRLIETQVKEAAQQAKTASHQVRDCAAQMHQMQLKLDEINRVQSARMDRLTQAFARLEQYQGQSVRELSEKYAGVASRVNERRVSDAKIEDLIDRHNDVVQGFETRLKQMQKVIAEREMQMLKTMTVLEDARAEIARMKKM
jgi:chromosome segregation ATPase